MTHLNRIVQILFAISALVSVLAFAIAAIVGYELLFADPPEVITVLPVRLAANPAETANWNFNVPRPTLHNGDALIADFHVCFSDIFGGDSVTLQSDRYLESFDGTTRATLIHSSMTFPVGCRITHSIIGAVPLSFPPGTYRVVGETVAYTQHYSRPLQWVSVWFDVAAAPSP